MNKKAVIIVLLVLALPYLSFAEEYMSSPVLKGSKTTHEYFNEIGIPNVSVGTKCPEKGDCWPVIQNQDGRVLKSFSAKHTVRKIASGRYRDYACILVEHNWKCGKEYCSETFIVDYGGRKTKFFEEYDKRVEGESLDKIVSRDGNLIILSSKGITELGKDGSIVRTVPSPMQLKQGILRNNPDGDIAVMAIGKNDEIFISNLKAWTSTNFILSERGDRKGILGAYPDADVIYCVVYKYVNEYNKGLHTITAEFDGTKFTVNKGLLFNSEDRNVGFDPDVHTEGNNVIIGAKDSSNNKLVHFNLPKGEISEIRDVKPLHTVGFEKEKSLAFLGGGGVSYISWVADSQVEKGDVTYMDVDYDISGSLFWLGQFEGRFGKTHIAVNYLRNQAESYIGKKGGELTKRASQFLLGKIDFHGLLPKPSSLRLVIEKSEINGVAKWKRNETFPAEDDEEFSTEYYRFAGLLTRERGLYGGLEYVKYQMPSAVGFSDSSKSIVYTAFDKELEINKISLLFGYDMLAYAKRYETDYSKFYFAGNIGFGLGWLSISDEIRREAKEDTKKEDIDTPLFVALDGTLEAGYIWQQRIKRWKGFGYSINLGYRAKGVYMGAGQAKESEATTKGLAVEFQRYDILHGPFIQCNLIF